MRCGKHDVRVGSTGRLRHVDVPCGGQLEVDATAELTGRAEATLDAVTSPAKVSRDKAFEFGLDAVIEGLKAKVATERQLRSRARARERGRVPSQASPRP